NIAPPEGSAKLAGVLIRETIALGGQACRPLLARDGLGPVFVEPAVSWLRQHGVSVAFEDEVVALQFSDGRASQLQFAKHSVDLGADDAVVLAVPPYVAAKLVPGLTVPTAFRGIVNAHFRVVPPATLPPILGVISGTSQWIFSLPGRICVTISDGGDLFDAPRAELAQSIWNDVAAATGLSTTPALADRARAAGDVLVDSGAECAPAGRANTLEQSAACRRLDGHRAARDDRECD